jgi:cobalt transporter subunit CbtB
MPAYNVAQLNMRSTIMHSSSDYGVYVRAQVLCMRPTLAERSIASLFLIVLAVLLLFFTAFHHSHVLHNAAHDVRHAFAFPCH